MRVYGKSYCYVCERSAPAAEGSIEDLGFGICAQCRLPTVAAFDYFGQRFQCLEDGKLHDIDSILHRFEPQKDLARDGIWCEAHWPGTAPGSRRINRSFSADPRFIPPGEKDVSSVVDLFEASINGMSDRNRRRLRERFDTYRNEHLHNTPRAEQRFAEILDTPTRRTLAWKWERQRVLLDAYIVDFFFERARLIVEIDGDDHVIDPKLFWDQVRDEHLRRHGYRVIRFWNGSVLSPAHGGDILAHVEDAYNERHIELHQRPAFNP